MIFNINLLIFVKLNLSYYYWFLANQEIKYQNIRQFLKPKCFYIDTRHGKFANYTGKNKTQTRILKEVSEETSKTEQGKF